MTTVIGLSSLVKALEVAREVISSGSTPDSFWSGTNPMQRMLMEMYPLWAERITQMPGIDGMATGSAEEARQWLEEKGMELEVPDPVPANAFLALGYNEIIVKWLEKHAQRPLDVAGTEVPAFYAEDQQCFTVNGRDIVALRGEGGAMVYVTKIMNSPENPLHVMQGAEELHNGLTQVEPRLVDAHVPMVDIDVTPSLDWLLNLETHDKSWFIAAAAQRVKLFMDHIGAEAKEATVVMPVFRGAPVRTPEVVKIDGPMLMWFVEPGVDGPSFAAYITPEDFKQPQR